MVKAWAILNEQGEAVAAWVSHSAALAESHGLPVVPCVISVAWVDKPKGMPRRDRAGDWDKKESPR